MSFVRFDEKSYEKYKGQRLYGRVMQYSPQDGYGFIHTEIGKDIMLSSYELKRKENKINVGTVLTFIPEKFDDKYSARNIEIYDNSIAKQEIILPNGEALQIRDIAKIGCVSGENAVRKRGISVKELLAHGYSPESFRHIFIVKRSGEEFDIYQKGSLILGSGQVDDLDGLYSKLWNRLVLL